MALFAMSTLLSVRKRWAVHWLVARFAIAFAQDAEVIVGGDVSRLLASQISVM